MNAKVVFVVCAALVACCSAVECVNTIVSSETGKSYEYNLKKLSHPAGEKDSLSYRMPDGSYLFMNICGPSSEKCTSGTAVCLRSSDYSEFTSLGKVDTQQVSEATDLEPGKGVQVTYSNGDECVLGSWETVITLACDPTIEGEITDVDTGDCWFKATVSSKYACGVPVSGSSATSGGDASGQSSGDVVALVILIILLVCVVLYFGLGVFYQKKFKEASTFREYIIHNEFWCSLPSLIKDGVLFIFHGCKKGDYVSV